MGTRHLIAVQLNGKYRIAQYGQWDGYPSAQGATVLNFLKTEMDRPKFETALRAASFLTKEDMDAINAEIEAKNLKDKWQKVWPHLSRDAGGEILQMVQDADAGIKLKDEIDFAANSLFCEWGYVIDLDANTLEVFRGFQKEPVPEGDRFANFEPTNKEEKADGYYPIRRVASYSLDALPTQEQLERDADPPEDEDQDDES